MSGIKNQSSVLASTETTLYTVPASKEGTYDVMAVNTTDTEATAELWFTTTTTTDAKKYAKEQFERSIHFKGLILDAGQKIIIKTTQATSVTVKGVEASV